MNLSKKLRKRIKQIKEIQSINPHYTNKEIAKILILSESNIKYVKHAGGIKSENKVGRNKNDISNLRKVFFSIINKEHAQYPLSDEKIHLIFKKIGIGISRWSIWNLRKLMKIPPADKNNKLVKTRKQIYFSTKKRKLWKN